MALAHPEWDLSAYSEVNSDYWEVKVSAEGVDPPAEVSAGSAEGGDPAKEVREAETHNAGETQATGATRETMLIIDDEPVA